MKITKANLYKKIFTEKNNLFKRNKDASAIVETLMVIIICVAICAIFKANLSALFSSVWGTLSTNVQALFA